MKRNPRHPDFRKLTRRQVVSFQKELKKHIKNLVRENWPEVDAGWEPTNRELEQLLTALLRQVKPARPRGRPKTIPNEARARDLDRLLRIRAHWELCKITQDELYADLESREVKNVDIRSRTFQKIRAQYRSEWNSLKSFSGSARALLNFQHIPTQKQISKLLRLSHRRRT